jgi:endonuclease G, mitochondrial
MTHEGIRIPLRAVRAARGRPVQGKEHVRLLLKAIEEPRMLIDTLKREQEQKAKQRYVESKAERQKVTDALRHKTPLEVDSSERVRARLAAIDPHDGLSLERIIGRSDLVPVAYFETGLRAARSVCRIELHSPAGSVTGYGTGFLISPDLMLTNNHVLPDRDTARFAIAQFNYENDAQRQPRPTRNFMLEPDRFFVTDRNLDFSLVAIATRAAEGVTLREFGYLQLWRESGKALVGECVSIIQHASGSPKVVAVRENKITNLVDHFIHYTTDTEPGSSGSPVMNDSWQVVALHHAGVPDPDNPEAYIANEGARVSSILKHLDKLRSGWTAAERALADTILSSATVTAGAGGIDIETPTVESYRDLKGFDTQFLEMHAVPLPKLGQALVGDTVDLNDGSGSLLHYTNFSLAMSKSRRLAFFTAVNIDGRHLVNLPRASDKWFFDPRIDPRYQSGPELYANNDLDRGHLVRRLDPVWGPRASRANDDTFHFTNCSPQHKNLNQKTWLSLEDYILGNAGAHGLRVCVFTGPVFRDDDLVYRGEFRIPAEFWKVVAIVKDDGTLSATAYLQTQKNLIDNLEFAFGAYKTYQVPVSRIERITQLDFGPLRSADPLGTFESSVAGRVIEGPQDLLL